MSFTLNEVEVEEEEKRLVHSYFSYECPKLEPTERRNVYVIVCEYLTDEKVYLNLKELAKRNYKNWEIEKEHNKNYIIRWQTRNKYDLDWY